MALDQDYVLARIERQAAGAASSSDITTAINNHVAAVRHEFSKAAKTQIAPFNDFTGSVPVTTLPAEGWVWVPTLTGTIVAANPASGTRDGLWQLQTGTNSTAIAAIARGSINNVTVGGGEIVIETEFRLPILGTASERLYVQSGLRDAWDSSTANNRILAYYQDNVNGGALQLLVRSGGVDTTANGTTVLVANTFYYVKLVINAAGTEVKMYVGTTEANATLEATVSSGVPTASMRAGILLGKSVGTTTRNLDVDYFVAERTLSTAR